MPPFEDPKLKSAVRALGAGHQADPALRRRIEGLLSANADDVAGSLPRRFRVGRILAVAAMLVIFIDGLAGYLQYRHLQREQAEYAANDALLDAMVDADGLTGTELKSPLTDFAAVASEASAALGRAVPMVDLSKHGWTLYGATICKVHELPAARFSFLRGDQKIIVLSLPASAWADAQENSEYAMLEDGHAITGYIRSGSLNCVVGDKLLSQADAIKLRDAIRRG